MRQMNFDQAVPNDGYAWWYIDALSDDGQLGITLIAFIGSVFSPYYRRARRLSLGDPLNHCGLNVALYGARANRWALTERGRASVRRTQSTLAIGPSSLHWDGSALTIAIDEVTVPLPSRLRGTVRLYPLAVESRVMALDAEGRHRWSPLAPCARVEVALESPALRFSGPGYLDTNAGDAPLEADFSTWQWSRAPVRRGTAVLYEVIRRDGTSQRLALRYDAAGGVAEFEPPARAALPRTLWRMPRETRSESETAIVRRTLEDTPFYARSVLSARLHGEDVTALHESLSLDRFRSTAVQLMLPFRMPREFSLLAEPFRPGALVVAANGAPYRHQLEHQHGKHDGL